ncbi:MAG: glycosyltransferase [Gemmiger sp.]
MDLRLKRIKELFGYAAALRKEQGLAAMLRRAAGFFKRRFFGKKARYLPAKAVLQKQRDDCAGNTCGSWPVITILTPLYNTPTRYLTEFLDSVQGQTCPCWQLVLADASDAEHAQVGELARSRAAADSRIVYAKIENRGIAANTNAAAQLAAGEYLALADHDDVLAPHAIWCMEQAILARRDEGKQPDFLYSDEALFTKNIRRPTVGHFKPDYAPEYLMACNYICHLAVFRRELWQAVGGERPECDGAQDHDLFLRLIDLMHKTDPAAAPLHLPQVLYYWRVHAASTSGGTGAKPYVVKAAQKAVADHLSATGRSGRVEEGLFPGTCHVEWALPGWPDGPAGQPEYCIDPPRDAARPPLVSILIPNKDHTDDLEKCLHSIYARTAYDNFEVIVIENNSTEPATRAYYRTLPDRYENCRVVGFTGGFNFSRINNFGRRFANGKFLLLLNNDVEVLNAAWLGELVAEASQPGVGAAGAMLYYPDNTVQHGGIITGLGGYAGHSHKYHKRGGSGYMFRLATVQDFSAVTAACLLVRTKVYDEQGGMDEGFTVAFNDVDFCLRVRDAGWRIVWTPYAELYHYESKSRGSDENDPVKKARFAQEHRRLYEKHGRDNILRDPYYNPSLSLDYEDFRESGDLRNLKECRL